MNRHPVVGGGVLLAAALLWSSPAAAQTASPLDTAQAVGLLRESVAALEASDYLRRDRDFQRHLAVLFGIWGEEWSPPPPALIEPPVHEITDSLTRLGEIDGALTLALEQEGLARRLALAPVLGWMAEHGQADRALAFSDSIGESTLAIIAILHSSRPLPTDWRAEVDRISRFLRETSRDSARLDENWSLVVGFVAPRDFRGALDIARSESALRRPLFKLLTIAAERRLAIADSLLLDTYERAMALPDPTSRIVQLRWLKNVCADHGLGACDSLPIPENLSDLMPSRVTNRLNKALSEGRWGEGSVIGDTLRDLVSTERYALILAEALVWVPSRRGYDSVSAILLPWLDSTASQMRGPSADSLNARLAGLWAVPDPDRAQRAVARIDADALRTAALTNLARAAYPTNSLLAFEALRQGGSGSQHLRLPSLYVELLLYGDTARAEQVYRMLKSGADRMNARLRWAGVVRGAGRWSEAYRLAFEALDEWDPAAEPRPLALGLFAVFANLGVYDELIAWGRARETADARASALASLVGSVFSYRPPRGVQF